MENDIKQEVEITQIAAKKKHWIWVFLRKYFITGIVAILPLWICYWLISLVFKWVSGFSMPYTLPIVKMFVAGAWVIPVVRLISFMLSIGIISFVGYLTTKLLGKKALSVIEKNISKFPVLGSVYTASKKFLDFIVHSDAKSVAFKYAVLVPYPTKDSYSIAFLTGQRLINGQKYSSVFMPTVPNISTGFLLLYKESDIITNISFSVDEAFQFILSGGVVSNHLELIKQQAENK
jgi:uncharacterized membrane protein